MKDISTSPTSVQAAMRLVCPCCGKGKLFSGLVKMHDSCGACGFDIARHDIGDGAVFFVLVIVGFMVVGMAALLEIAAAPPLWVHLLLLAPATVGLALLSLRHVKAMLLAMQYRHRQGDFH